MANLSKTTAQIDAILQGNPDASTKANLLTNLGITANKTAAENASLANFKASLAKYDSSLVAYGLAKAGDSAPTAVLNRAYMAVDDGTIFGIQNVKKGDYLTCRNTSNGYTVEPVTATLDKVSKTVFKMPETPGTGYLGISDTGVIGVPNQTNAPDTILFYLDVSKFSKVSFSANIYTIDTYSGAYCFLNESLTVLAGSRPNYTLTNLAIPSGSKYLAFGVKKTIVDAGLTLTFTPSTAQFISEKDVVNIPNLWDGEYLNLSYHDGSTRVLNNHYAVLRAGLSEPVKKFRYVNPEDLNSEQKLYLGAGDRMEVRSWIQYEQNTVKQYYLKKTVNGDGTLTFSLGKELKGRLALNPSPAQNGWNDGMAIYDKGGNKMSGSVGRTNVAVQYKANPFAYTLVQPVDRIKYLLTNELYYTVEPIDTYEEPKASNLVTQDRVYAGDLTYNSETNTISQANIADGVTSGSQCALYIKVKPNTKYYVLPQSSFIGGTLLPPNAIYEMDADKAIVNVIASTDPDNFSLIASGAATFSSDISGYCWFKTGATTSFVCLKFYAHNTAILKEDAKCIICEPANLLSAVVGNLYSTVNKSDLLGDAIQRLIKNTQKDIWILGDSISATGYGGSLAAVEKSTGSIGGWVKYFNDIIKPTTTANYAAGGYTVTDASTTFIDGVVQGATTSYVERIEAAIADYIAGNIKAPDYLLISGCTNDFGRSRSNPNGWSNRSFVTEDDLASATLNPDGLNYDEFMDLKFIADASLNIVPIESVPLFKLAGALRYIIQRVGTIFPNCKFMIISSLQSPAKWIDQENCHREMKWLANRLSIPFVDVHKEANTPILWDLADSNAASHPRRFINDGYHPYGAADSAGSSFITAGAMRQGKYIAEMFKKYCEPISDKEILAISYDDASGYPSAYNVK